MEYDDRLAHANRLSCIALARLTSTHVGAWVYRGAPQRPPYFLPEHDGLTEPLVRKSLVQSSVWS